MTKLKSTLYVLCIFMFLLAGFVIFMENAEAATYNFNFNNTEQGDNSTATPTVTIRDGKLVPYPETTSQSSESSPIDGSISTAKIDPNDSTFNNRWKVHFGYSGATGHTHPSLYDLAMGKPKLYSNQATLGLSYRLTRKFSTGIEGFIIPQTISEPRKIFFAPGNPDSPPKTVSSDGFIEQPNGTMNFGAWMGYELVKFRPTKSTTVSILGLTGIQSVTKVAYDSGSLSRDKFKEVSTSGYARQWDPYAGLQSQCDLLDSIGLEIKAKRLFVAKQNFYTVSMTHSF